jgi:hypothetical protein
MPIVSDLLLDIFYWELASLSLILEVVGQWSLCLSLIFGAPASDESKQEGLAA